MKLRLRPTGAGLPAYGSLWRRNSDGVLFAVVRVYPRDLQVRLEPQIPGAAERAHPFLPQLLRDYTQEA